LSASRSCSTPSSSTDTTPSNVSGSQWMSVTVPVLICTSLNFAPNPHPTLLASDQCLHPTPSTSNLLASHPPSTPPTPQPQPKTVSLEHLALNLLRPSQHQPLPQSPSLFKHLRSRFTALHPRSRKPDLEHRLNQRSELLTM
jgi:hypothetical protein